MAFGLAFVPVALTALATVHAPAADAETPPPATEIRHGNTFYAYVGPGENLDVSFLKGSDIGGALGVTITVSGPGGVTQTCTLTGAELVGTGCNFTDLMSATPGVWEIVFDAPVVVPGDPVPNSADSYNWDIQVQGGATDIPGRVWTEQYQMRHAGPAAFTDFTLYYQSEQGFQYQASYLGYNGIDSTFSSNATGNALVGTCTPAYESFDGVGPYSDTATFAMTTDECGARYKIFFEQPDPALPPTATRWDGGQEWVQPPVVLPDLTNLQFAQDPATMTRSGQFTFDSANFSGNAALQIDANNDGDYDDPEDRSIPVAILADGTHVVDFDGLDGLGNPISILDPIRSRVLVNQAAEIHFVNWDVERRDGLEVIALNGPSAGSTILYWDDTNLRIEDRDCVTPILDGTGGIDSTGGVHGWTCVGNANNGVNGSWGDVRAIDDWTYQRIAEQVELAIAGYVTDFGDAPDAYGTTLANDGPFHAVPGYDPETGTAPLMLGTTIDAETDGSPSGDAAGDDATGGDEDGVAGPIMAGPAGSTVTVPVTVTNTSGRNAVLAAWIDLNGNGVFEPGEMQTVTVPSAPGPQVVNVSWPLTASVTSPTYARFRLFPEGVDPATILPTGPSPAGEVEDYLVLPIPPVTEIDKEHLSVVPHGDGTATVTYRITVTQSDNDGSYDLDDELRYGAGIEVLGATVTNVTPGDIALTPGWDGLTALRVADDVPITVGVSHTYEVAVHVAADGATLTPESADCTLQDGEDGTGLLNTATVITPIDEDSDDACPPVPITSIAKDVVEVVPNEDGTSTVTYTVTVSQTGGDGLYDLEDRLQFGDGAQVTEASVVNVMPGGVAVNESWDGIDDISVADDVPIAVGTSHAYEVTVVTDVLPDSVTEESGDCSLQQNESGTGYLNTAVVTTDEWIDIDVACAPIDPPGQLPVSGASVAGPVAIGSALIGAGTAARWAARRRRPRED